MTRSKTKKNFQPEKKLIKILKKHAGRDNTGSVSVRHRGSRQKRYYRIIDFKRDKKNIKGEVIRIEKDPNRSANIALVRYEDGQLRYIIQPEGLKEGDVIVAGENVEIKVGNALPLKNIPLGILVHNINLYPGSNSQIVRGAGTAATVVAKEGKYVHLKLPSGEVRKFLGDCYAVIGRVSNVDHNKEVIGKAGRKILLGINPTVRGTAQNPRSHPHGGGEGRSGEGMHPKTPWGKPAKGKKTRKKNKPSDKFIVKKRN